MFVDLEPDMFRHISLKSGHHASFGHVWVFFLIMIFFLGQFMITLCWNQYVHSRFFLFNDLILLISKVSLLLFITLCRLIWWYPVIDFKVQERKKIHEGLHRYFIYWKIWLEKLIICGFFFSGDETSVKSFNIISWNNGWKDMKSF